MSLSSPKTDVKSRNLFVKALLQDVNAMEHMLQNDWFENDIVRIGAEQELVIIDKENYRPRTIATEVLAAHDNYQWLVSELAQFNLEINLSPQVFEKNCLSLMRGELETYLNHVRHALEPYNSDYLLTGILPTLHKYHLDLKNLTPKKRYLDLMNALHGQLSGNSFELKLVGIDELFVKHDSPLLEACNTSFQVHLQVSPENFVEYYNCALALTAPCIAIASNSPIVFGKRLWHESRIALFQQAIDTRRTLDHMRQMSPRVTLGNRWVDESVMEIFKEDIARFRVIMHAASEENSIENIEKRIVPKLKSLQLHNSTIYRWNRPCYGISDTGKPHLRIENRIFPAGPTVLDEMANMAFWLGAMVGMRSEYGNPRQKMSFEDVRDNFGKATRFGIDSNFTWFKDRKVSARDLVLEELLPLSREGLKKMNVDGNDINTYLNVIEARAKNHMTGARWMLRSYTRLSEMTSTKDEALTILTASIHTNQNKSNNPVHTWKEPTLEDYQGYDPENLNVSEFMETDLLTAHRSDLAQMVLQLMEWKDFSYMPVEDKRGILVGLLSMSDLKAQMEKENNKSKPRDLQVRDVMQKNPMTLGPNESIQRALTMMKEYQLTCLPVVRNKELVGLLTESNCISINKRLQEK